MQVARKRAGPLGSHHAADIELSETRPCLEGGRDYITGPRLLKQVVVGCECAAFQVVSMADAEPTRARKALPRATPTAGRLAPPRCGQTDVA